MKCRACNTDKDASAFYSTNKSRCKECVKASATAHRLANLESVRAYDRLRGSMAHRVAARAEYRQTPAYAQSHEAAAARWRARHPERRKANTALGNAVRNGRLVPWPVCAVPDCERTDLHGHHADYSRPLDVVWLCPTHHKQAHALVSNADDTQEAA